MNIIDRAKAFVHSLETLAKRTIWDWRECPACGQTDTMRYGTYTVHPWHRRYRPRGDHLLPNPYTTAK